MPRPTSLPRLYDSLSRYQWALRRLSRSRSGQGLEMHKRLGAPSAGAPGPGAGTEALNAWLRSLVSLPPEPAIVDVGCGFGATLFQWAAAMPGTFVGLSLSPFQIRKATEEAGRLGVADRVTFRAQSYADPIDGVFDLAVSVESLFHAADLGATIANIGRSLRPGGGLLLVEDTAVDPGVAETEHARDLLARWATDRLYTADDYRRALAAAGFVIDEELDLTAQVGFADGDRLNRRAARLARLRRLTPLAGGRRLIDAFLGGISLERLYATGAMRYLTIRASRERSDA